MVGESGERGRLKLCRGRLETDTVHYLQKLYEKGQRHYEETKTEMSKTVV